MKKTALFFLMLAVMPHYGQKNMKEIESERLEGISPFDPIKGQAHYRFGRPVYPSTPVDQDKITNSRFEIYMDFARRNPIYTYLHLDYVNSTLAYFGNSPIRLYKADEKFVSRLSSKKNLVEDTNNIRYGRDGNLTYNNKIYVPWVWVATEWDSGEEFMLWHCAEDGTFLVSDMTIERVKYIGEGPGGSLFYVPLFMSKINAAKDDIKTRLAEAADERP